MAWYRVGNNNSDVNLDWDNITNKPNIPVSANLTGQAAVFGQTQESGNAPTFARSDHYHSLPNVNWADIGGKPTIPNAQIQADWAQTTATALDYIKNKPAITTPVQSDWNQGTSTALDYIKNKPTIPAAQIQADWNQTTTTALDYIKNKPSNFGGSSFWSGSNTGGDCNTVTTPGQYSGNWTSNAPAGVTWGALLVMASDTGTSYREQLFIQEGTNKMWFRGSVNKAWTEVGSGASFWSGENTGGDCNIYTTPGCYSGNWTANSPIPGSGALLVLATTTSFNSRAQIFIKDSGTFDSGIWFRKRVPGTWLPLITQWNVDDFGKQLTLCPDKVILHSTDVSVDPAVVEINSKEIMLQKGSNVVGNEVGFKFMYDSSLGRLNVLKKSSGQSTWSAATWNSAGYFS